LKEHLHCFRGQRLEQKAETIYFRLFTRASLSSRPRHSFACQRLDEGFPMHKVKTVLGHSDPRTTERYGEYSAEALEDIIEGEVVNTKLIVQVNRQPVETKKTHGWGARIRTFVNIKKLVTNSIT